MTQVIFVSFIKVHEMQTSLLHEIDKKQSCPLGVTTTMYKKKGGGKENVLNGQNCKFKTLYHFHAFQQNFVKLLR